MAMTTERKTELSTVRRRDAVKGSLKGKWSCSRRITELTEHCDAPKERSAVVGDS